ncbi:MAG: 4-alpha-glucanotransferase, partial [Clostridiales bacterium]|nr:4-alpha-glucanotransferase [Clostridiales bacterium]
LWQVLPIGPTSYGDSPYQNASVYAYNPYFIDFDLLEEEGLLKKKDYEKVDFGDNPLIVDYAKLFLNKMKVLKKAFINKKKLLNEYNAFLLENSYWLDDFSLFSVIKSHNSDKAWNTWEDKYRLRDKEALKLFKTKNNKEINEIKFIQFLFRRQWDMLKAYAKSSNVEIIGDMPIYVAYDSADTWANPELFELDKNLKPINVAGCPPDKFALDGQLWGNPIYNWEKMKNDNYSWWVKRLNASLLMYDIVRIDHFRGFSGYYSIPFVDTTARNGVWIPGPGMALFEELNKAVPNAKIIAENLGFIDEETEKLLEDSGYPGMIIAQFEIANKVVEPFKEGFPVNNVIYTGTHDNQTINSWFEDLTLSEREYVEKECMFDINYRPNLKLIERVFHTAPKWAVIPWQDYLGLKDCEGRMNIPSTLGGNWTYRSKKTDFRPDISKFMRKITAESDRQG